MITMELHALNLRLFRNLSVRELGAFVKYTEAVMKQYPKGSSIIEAFGQSKYIFCILEGTGQVVAEDCFGNETLGYKLEKGELVGITEAIGEIEQSFVSVEALTDMVLLRIPYDKISSYALENPSVYGILMKNILYIYSKRMGRMMERLELVSQRTMRQRIIMYLVQEGKHQRTNKVRVPGRIQLARLLGCHRSALTREISAMKDLGILAVDGDTIELL